MVQSPVNPGLEFFCYVLFLVWPLVIQLETELNAETLMILWVKFCLLLDLLLELWNVLLVTLGHCL